MLLGVQFVLETVTNLINVSGLNLHGRFSLKSHLSMPGSKITFDHQDFRCEYLLLVGMHSVNNFTSHLLFKHSLDGHYCLHVSYVRSIDNCVLIRWPRIVAVTGS